MHHTRCRSTRFPVISHTQVVERYELSVQDERRDLDAERQKKRGRAKTAAHDRGAVVREAARAKAARLEALREKHGSEVYNEFFQEMTMLPPTICGKHIVYDHVALARGGVGSG